MKLSHIPEGLEITNTPRTVLGVIFTAVTPLVLGSALADWFVAGEPLSESWFALAEVGVLTVCWIIWLFTGFRKRVLTYAYVFDKSGVREKRLLGKGKYIAWTDMGEYICEYVGHKDKTRTRVFCVTFTSSHKDSPVTISTPSFPETELPVFRDKLFAFCDAMRATAARG